MCACACLSVLICWSVVTLADLRLNDQIYSMFIRHSRVIIVLLFVSTGMALNYIYIYIYSCVNVYSCGSVNVIGLMLLC